MKLTELKCTACNGSLELSKSNPSLAVCKYCGATYVIAKDRDEKTYLKSINQPQKTYVAVEEKSKQGEYLNWKRGMIVSLIVVVMLIATRWESIVTRYETEHMVEQESKEVISEVKAPETIELKGVLGQVVTKALQKSADEIKLEELVVFKSICIKYTGEELLVGYGLGEDTSEAEMEWVSFPRDTAEKAFKELAYFKGLKNLEVAGYLTPEMVEGLQLETLTCYAKSPKEIAEMIEPTILKGLTIFGGLESIEGISKFQNLEELNLRASKLIEIKELVSLSKLKALKLENGDEMSDFTVLSLLSSLEKLSIESEKLRDLGFLTRLKNLKSFSVIDAQLLEVNELGQLNQLTELIIEDCDEVKAFSALEGLTNLKHLVLEIPYKCPTPDLSKLTGLKQLSISGAKDISFLSDMTQLEVLSLKGCDIDEPEVFSHLKGLKTLKCASVSMHLPNWDFVTNIPALESLDLRGISTYEDLSGIFGMDSLKNLWLSGIKGEIDFSNIKENPSLIQLEMNGVKLYKNAEVTGGGGVYQIYYDDVSLEAHIDFLKNFPNLRDLSVAENKLTKLDFAKSLHLLETLDISQNYITDLRPLEGLSKLKWLNCTENPIENKKVLGEEVIIIN